MTIAPIEDMDVLRKYDATRIADTIETFLAKHPDRVGKSRIKKLRGRQMPDYRLRVGHYRVFYTIDREGRTVIVLRVLHKDQTKQFYEED